MEVSQGLLRYHIQFNLIIIIHSLLYRRKKVLDQSTYIHTQGIVLKKRKKKNDSENS